MEHGPNLEDVFPIKKMGIFQLAMLVYQRGIDNQLTFSKAKFDVWSLSKADRFVNFLWSIMKLCSQVSPSQVNSQLMSTNFFMGEKDMLNSYSKLLPEKRKPKTS